MGGDAKDMEEEGEGDTSGRGDLPYTSHQGRGGTLFVTEGGPERAAVVCGRAGASCWARVAEAISRFKAAMSPRVRSR